MNNFVPVMYSELVSTFRKTIKYLRRSDYQLAAWNGDFDAVEKLISEVADLEYVDSDGFTAPARAKDNGHDDIVILLEGAAR